MTPLKHHMRSIIPIYIIDFKLVEYGNWPYHYFIDRQLVYSINVSAYFIINTNNVQTNPKSISIN